MLATALHVLPILAAEKSKVPFFIAGGLLAAWAVFVSMGIGMRRHDFPRTVSGQRGVIAVSAVLVIAAVSTAVITSGVPAKTITAPKGGSAAPGKSSAPTGSSPASAGVASTISDAADPSGQLKFTKSTLTAAAGRVTIDFTNASPLMHNLTVARGATVLGATPTFQGGMRSFTLNLTAGTYVFYCSVPGHRAAGMVGTLTVTAAGASSPASAGVASTISDAADPSGQLKFTKSTLTAAAGRVTIDFTNASPLMHNLTVARGATVLGATPTFQGGMRSFTLNLAAGTYVFYCSVPGHRAAGMVGTLTVTAAAASSPAGASGPASAGVASTISDAADPSGQLKFTKSTLTAAAGRVTIDFTNASPLMHNLTVARGATVLGATPTFQGGMRSFTLNLAAGTYVFYCSVPGHRAAGMVGTLTVTG